jgi:chromosome segregation ATPase
MQQPTIEQLAHEVERLTEEIETIKADRKAAKEYNDTLLTATLRRIDDVRIDLQKLQAEQGQSFTALMRGQKELEAGMRDLEANQQREHNILVSHQAGLKSIQASQDELTGHVANQAAILQQILTLLLPGGQQPPQA